MGRLEHTDSGRVVPLRVRHLVGRAPEADLRLDTPRVSSRHAEIYYLDGAWHVRDLGSRNGTLVDGAPVVPRSDVRLSLGSRIEWAGCEGVWTLASDAPPERAITSVEAGDHTVGESLGSLVLRFVVSRDEEHVELTVRWGSGAYTPPARTHAYTLLTLARIRLAAERAADLPPSERGWISQDELCHLLRVDANLLHTHLFRARRQLAEGGVPDVETLIERRLGGALRIGVSSLEVVTT